MRPTLRGYAQAVIESAVEADAGQLVLDELGAFEDLLAREGRLTAVLTDTAVPVAARRAVIEDLMAQRLDPATLRLVLRALVEERGDQFANGVHDVRELARLMVELPLEDGEDQVRGRSAVRSLIGGYAAAVFETLPTVGDLEEVEDELFRFARIVESSPELRSALSDPGRPAESRKDMVKGLLEGRARDATIRLACAALGTKIRDLVQVLDWLVERAAEARGWRVARVHAARDIDGTERQGLDEALRRLTGLPVELQVTVEPELLGGVVVEVGDLLVDASARHRLEQIEEHLLGVEGATRGAMS
ncbi:MAG TPA: ATP synthase F1 subunit delta [Acidimicrobiales bacterium]|nr:ATP synthase F1 subunit delta [Acidimicrobiales bacterium]